MAGMDFGKINVREIYGVNKLQYNVDTITISDETATITKYLNEVETSSEIVTIKQINNGSTEGSAVKFYCTTGGLTFAPGGNIELLEEATIDTYSIVEFTYDSNDKYIMSYKDNSSIAVTTLSADIISMSGVIDDLETEGDSSSGDIIELSGFIDTNIADISTLDTQLNDFSATRGSYSTTFTSGALTSGKLTVTHALSSEYINLLLFDDNKEQVMPDIRVLDELSVEMSINNFAIVAGTWQLAVMRLI